VRVERKGQAQSLLENGFYQTFDGGLLVERAYVYYLFGWCGMRTSGFALTLPLISTLLLVVGSLKQICIKVPK